MSLFIELLIFCQSRGSDVGYSNMCVLVNLSAWYAWRLTGSFQRLHEKRSSLQTYLTQKATLISGAQWTNTASLGEGEIANVLISDDRSQFVQLFAITVITLKTVVLPCSRHPCVMSMEVWESS